MLSWSQGPAFGVEKEHIGGDSFQMSTTFLVDSQYPNLKKTFLVLFIFYFCLHNTWVILFNQCLQKVQHPNICSDWNSKHFLIIQIHILKTFFEEKKKDLILEWLCSDVAWVDSDQNWSPLMLRWIVWWRDWGGMDGHTRNQNGNEDESLPSITYRQS